MFKLGEKYYYKLYKYFNLEKSFYSPPPTGVCNRIKRLFSFCRMNNLDINKDEIILYWALGHWVTHSFQDLFQIEGGSNIKCFTEFPESKQKDIYPPTIAGWRLYVSESDGITKDFAKVFPDVYPVIDLEYERIPQNVRDIYLPYFNKLKPSKLVQDKIDSLSIDESFVCVHNRNTWDWKSENRDSDISCFIKEMKKFPSTQKFFLACIEKEISEILNKEFPGQIYELPDKDWSSTVDAIAELYLLSKGSILIGSYLSTFTECAWWLGGCRQKVIIADIPDIPWYIRRKKDLKPLYKKIRKKHPFRYYFYKLCGRPDLILYLKV